MNSAFSRRKSRLDGSISVISSCVGHQGPGLRPAFPLPGRFEQVDPDGDRACPGASLDRGGRRSPGPNSAKHGAGVVKAARFASGLALLVRGGDSPGKTTAAAAIAIVVAAILILLLMHRPPICTCGRIAIWGPAGQSRARCWPTGITSATSSTEYCSSLCFGWRCPAGQSAAVPDRFVDRSGVGNRRKHADGDQPLPRGDNGARLQRRQHPQFDERHRDDGGRLPGCAQAAAMVTVALVIVFELVPLVVIRDNLTLNVWMLLFPARGIAAWQAGARRSDRAVATASPNTLIKERNFDETRNPGSRFRG